MHLNQGGLSTFFVIFDSLAIRDYATTLATAVKKGFGDLSPELSPKAPFFSKAINIVIGMKAR